MRDLHPMIQTLSENILRAWGEHFIVREVGIPEDFRKIDRADDDDAVYIENFVWETHHFRKIHLEIAQMKSGLDILHTNMYPRYEYSLPIFGADIVASSKNVGAAIVDISSIREDRSLPSQYDILNVVEDKEFEKDKKMPDWGDVFSEHCVFVSPTEDEYDKFNSIAFTFLNYHCAIANITEATTDVDEIRRNYEGHKYYCEKQRQNNKTKGVLKGIFGEDFADKYIAEMLFDYPEL
jgi:phycocyanobilin:ferredoxin oxidoreductase